MRPRSSVLFLFSFLFLLVLFGCPPPGDDDSGPSLTPTSVPNCDIDGDGACPEDGDCDDGDPAVYPSATEICDGIDNDCDEEVDEELQATYCQDGDADHYGDPDSTTEDCSIPDGYATNCDDCDDGDPDVSPEAGEECDGVDNDCDGNVDEGLETRDYYFDGDGDGFGADDNTVEGCSPPDGYVEPGGDCDDDAVSVYPDADEVCDGIDNNCDTEIDEGVLQQRYADDDGDTYGNPGDPRFVCPDTDGTVLDSLDCNDQDPLVSPAASETCNGIDDDCDVEVDEGLESTFCRDRDGDGYGDSDDAVTGCEAPEGYAALCGDCDDNVDDDAGDPYPGAAQINTGATEVPYNGADDDCNPDTRDTDLDEDGYNDEAHGGDDCDDSQPTVYPGAEEQCDLFDNDCDGETNEGFPDLNDNGSADCLEDDIDCDGETLAGKDCDDAAPTGVADPCDIDCSVPPAEGTSYGGHCTHEDADEICDGQDNDCDSKIDEGVLETFYRDADGDGFGDPEDIEEACSAPAGYITEAEDCDDATGAAYPGAEEVCDGIDNDCDGEVDEGPTRTFYRDQDKDGYGDDSQMTEGSCAPGNEGDYVLQGEDCNDSDLTVYPGATERCNGIDDDCDGEVDEDVETRTYYRDDDEDGFGDPGSSEEACDKPDGNYVEMAGDCNDTEASINPDAAEECDEIDHNCNGAADDVTCWDTANWDQGEWETEE